MEDLKQKLVQKYTRKNPEVQAVRITEENIVDVAKWCGGVVRDCGVYESKLFIDVVAANEHSSWRTMAYIGEWMTTFDGEKFLMFTDDTFRSEFDCDMPEVKV